MSTNAGLQILKRFLLVGIFCGSALTQAVSKTKPAKIEPPALSISQRERASAEISTARTLMDHSSDAQMSGPIHLEDPRPQVITRKWKYLFEINLIDAIPSGQVRTDAGITYDMNSRGRFLIPELQFGIGNTLSTAGWWTTSLGAGFFSQSQSITLPSGFHLEDAGLSMMIVRANVVGGYILNQNWDLCAGLERGQYLINQVSSNDLAQFNRKAQYWGALLGADFKLDSGGRVIGRYVVRNETSDTQLLPQGNLEIGMKYLW